MNLQEEIVKALKTAADHIDASSYHYADFGMGFESSQNQELSFVLSQLATSVENARCETCEWWDSISPEECMYPESEDANDDAWVETCGANFGCWRYKEKVK